MICLTLNQGWKVCERERERVRGTERDNVNFMQFGGALAVFVEMEKKQMGGFSYVIPDFLHRVV